MQINLFIKQSLLSGFLALVAVGCVSPRLAEAADVKSVLEGGKLKNFKPGYYALKKGDEALCSEGMFEVNEDDSKTITMGAKHSVSYLAGENIDPCEDTSIPSCYDIDVTAYEFKGNTSVKATVTYTTKHGDKVVTSSTETFTIEKSGKIKLHVEESEDVKGKMKVTDKYNCEWEYQQKSL